MTDVMDPRAYIPMPSIIETTHRGERVWDIWTRLLRDRIVFLGTEIDDDVANMIIAQLLYPGEPRTPRRTSSCTSTAPAA